MKCPTCKEAGRSSTVRSMGQTRTLLLYEPYYDSEGNRHHHDSNTVREGFECSNGHRFTRVSKGSCVCGWKGMEPRIDMLEMPA